MLHVLAGSLIGATVGAITVVLKARMEGKAVDRAALGAMTLAGLVAGGVSAATLGAGGAAAAGAARGFLSAAAGGGAGGATHRLVTNVQRGRQPTEGLPDAAATGAVVGVVSHGVGTALAPVGARLSGSLPRVSSVHRAALPAPLRAALSRGPALSPALRSVAANAADAAGSLGSAYNVGAAGGLARRAMHNLVHDRPLGEELPGAAHEGGVSFMIGLGAARVAGPAVGAILPQAVAPASTTTPAPVIAAPSPRPTQGLRGTLGAAMGED